MPFLASAARFCDCLMSPEKPTTKQISPVASALIYSDEWNLRTEERTCVRRVEHMHAAILEFGELLRLEHHLPAVDPAVAEKLARLLEIVADAGRAPHVIDAV